MYWLIQWHLCVYRGVIVLSFRHLLLTKCHKLIKVTCIVSKLSKKNQPQYGYSILPLMMKEILVLNAELVLRS